MRVNIWQFQKKITRRLLGWAGFSISAGLGLLAAGPFWRGVGVQAIGWGAIDALIALIGQWTAGRRRARLPAPDAPDQQATEKHNLRLLLWANSVLDVLYMLAGLALIRTRGATDRSWRGHGWGIIWQGGFLFLFDLFHALSLDKDEQQA